MPRLALLLLLLLGGCDRWETTWVALGSRSVSGEWVGYGFPLSGATVKRSDPEIFIAEYTTPTQRDRQAAYDRWERTLARKHRRTARYGDLVTSRHRRTGFVGQDGTQYILQGERGGGAQLTLSVRRVTARR
jgi:hypothetical protein